MVNGCPTNQIGNSKKTTPLARGGCAAPFANSWRRVIARQLPRFSRRGFSRVARPPQAVARRMRLPFPAAFGVRGTGTHSAASHHRTACSCHSYRCPVAAGYSTCVLHILQRIARGLRRLRGSGKLSPRGSRRSTLHAPPLRRRRSLRSPRLPQLFPCAECIPLSTHRH